MAIDAYLILDGVKSESKDEKYPEAIKVEDFHWGANNNSNAHEGTGAASGKAEIDPMMITKKACKGSATLLRYCVTGNHFESGKVVFRRSGGASKVEYLVIQLKKVFVSSLQTSGTANQNNKDELMEVVGLQFGEFKYVFTPQADDGSSGVPADFGWNLPKNAQV